MNFLLGEKNARRFRVTISRVGWFSRALAFLSLYYPQGTTRSLINNDILQNFEEKITAWYMEF